MSAFQIVNPRRGAGGRFVKSRKRRSSSRRRKSSSKRRPRRKYYSRPRRRVARRRNPRMFGGKVFGLDLGQALGIAGGIVGTNVLTGYAATMVPPQFATGPARLLLKGGVAVVGSMIGRQFNRQIGNAIAVGGATAVILDVLNTYVLPALPLPAPGATEGVSGWLPEGMAGYTRSLPAGLSGYTGTLPVGLEGAYSPLY